MKSFIKIVLGFGIILTIFSLAIGSDNEELNKIPHSEVGSIFVCGFCDPGSQPPSVSVVSVTPDGDECCILLTGPPNTAFTLAWTSTGILCSGRTDSSGAAECCYDYAVSSNIAIIIPGTNECDCYILPSNCPE